MPLPISRSQLDRLGERLAAGDITPADDELLQAVLAAYDTAMAVAEGVVASAGYRATARLKTTGTLVDKLRREHGMKLKGVQDIAGLRIVLENGGDQDAAVARLKEAFEEASGSEVRVTDRRANPSHGYRAVHLIPKVQGLPVEVQVRTYFQICGLRASNHLPIVGDGKSDTAVLLTRRKRATGQLESSGAS